MRLTGKSYELFKNQKNKNYTEKNSILNKDFIIEDTLQPIDWEIVGCAEDVVGYKVTKAKGYVNGEEVVAYFTEDIAINDGPRGYWGLPGLILKVKANGKTIEAKSIQSLPDKVNITKPSGGKSVTKEEYLALKEEKEANLMSGYGGGNVITIQKGN